MNGFFVFTDSTQTAANPSEAVPPAEEEKPKQPMDFAANIEKVKEVSCFRLFCLIRCDLMDFLVLFTVWMVLGTSVWRSGRENLVQ